MEFRQRLGAMIRTIPPAQQAGIAVALIVLILASVMFFRWVTTPAYTVLYSGLEASQVQSVIDELESQGVPYKLEAAGTQILVPRSEVYEVRASLAAAGIQGTVVPQGYELLDGQSLTITDFQQRVAYQRALEGEIAKTLMAMQPIESATVHLVIPEEPLFEEERKPTTASVLVAPVRPLSDAEVESIISLVSSSVEGLEPSNVTVADAAGTVLHAAGEDATGAGMGSRTLRQTREFEQLLAQDLTSLLTTVLGPGRASVVVRAQLDFDQRTSESETFSKEEPPTLKEQTLEEEFTGAGAAPGGALGVDGGVVATGEGDYEYTKNETLREYGVDRVVTSITEAPGTIERLSVAVVVDDGTQTGATPIPVDEVQRLVSAAVGLDTLRGDVVEVSAIPFPASDEAPVAEEPEPNPLEAHPTEIAGAALLLIVALSFLFMGRSRRRRPVEVSPQPALEPAPTLEALPVGAPAELSEPAEPNIHDDVVGLVQSQPEEIAALLRSWLADRR